MTQQTAPPADRLKAASAKLDQPDPDLFTFEKAGDQIAGIIVDLEWMGGEYGPRLKITLDNGRGKRAAVFADHTALRSKLTKLRPQRGDAVAIRYLGSVDGKRSNYHDYRVTTDREADFRWEAPGAAPTEAANASQRHTASPASAWSGDWQGAEPPEDEPPF